MDQALASFLDLLEGAFCDTATAIDCAHGEITITLPRASLVETLKALRDGAQFKFVSLIDICGVDWPERAERFDVIYHLLSPTQNLRLRLCVRTDEQTAVPSVTPIFPGAIWFEREAYDLYGILFSGHPDLRRLLTDYGFEGHPLRKDFPLTGHVEVRYDDALKRVVYTPVDLQQAYRDFDFESPWEGPDYPTTREADTDTKAG